MRQAKQSSLSGSMVKSSLPMDNSSTAQRPPALLLTLGPRGVDTAEPEVVQPQNSTAQDVPLGLTKDYPEVFLNDGMSPMSRYFDGDSFTPVGQKPLMPLQFFGAPLAIGGSTTTVAGSLGVGSQQQASFSAYEPQFRRMLRPAVSEISRASEISRLPPVDTGDSDRRQSIASAISTQSTSTSSCHLIGRTETERGVPVAVYVDLSVLRETKKGRNTLMKPSSIGQESHASSNWRNDSWGSENRRRAQKRNN